MAKYIYRELLRDGFDRITEIDGQSKGNRHDLVQRFAPYYNDKSSSEVEDEINILVATDVLAEGLNLQDALTKTMLLFKRHLQTIEDAPLG